MGVGAIISEDGIVESYGNDEEALHAAYNGLVVRGLFFLSWPMQIILDVPFLIFSLQGNSRYHLPVQSCHQQL